MEVDGVSARQGSGSAGGRGAARCGVALAVWSDWRGRPRGRRAVRRAPFPSVVREGAAHRNEPARQSPVPPPRAVRWPFASPCCSSGRCSAQLASSTFQCRPARPVPGAPSCSAASSLWAAPLRRRSSAMASRKSAKVSALTSKRITWRRAVGSGGVEGESPDRLPAISSSSWRMLLPRASSSHSASVSGTATRVSSRTADQLSCPCCRAAVRPGSISNASATRSFSWVERGW